MPNGTVPERYHEVLTSSTLGHLATLDEHGRPRVNLVRLWTQ